MFLILESEEEIQSGERRGARAEGREARGGERRSIAGRPHNHEHLRLGHESFDLCSGRAFESGGPRNGNDHNNDKNTITTTTTNNNTTTTTTNNNNNTYNNDGRVPGHLLAAEPPGSGEVLPDRLSEQLLPGKPNGPGGVGAMLLKRPTPPGSMRVRCCPHRRMRQAGPGGPSVLRLHGCRAPKKRPQGKHPRNGCGGRPTDHVEAHT